MLKLAFIPLAAVGLFVGLVMSQNVAALVPGNNVLVSMNLAATGPGNNHSPVVQGMDGLFNPMSADGRYVAFYGDANNLVANDTNNKADVFVRDTKNGTTVRANLSASGVQANSGLPMSKYNGLLSTRQSVAISSSGRYVAFISGATNLIDGQTLTSYQANQVYIKDMKTGSISIVTKTSSGTLGYGAHQDSKPSPLSVSGVSDDGRFILWGGYKNIPLDTSGTSINGAGHMYVSDVKNSTVRLINAPVGYSGDVTLGFDARMSCDGAYIVLSSNLALDPASPSGGIFLVDVRSGYSITRLQDISDVNANFAKVNISCNGRYVTFNSASNSFSQLVSTGNTTQHNYLYDRFDQSVTLLNISQGGVLGNSLVAGSTSVDDKGNVAFKGHATNLVDGSTKPAQVIYFKNRSTGLNEVLSLDIYGNPVQSLNGNQYLSISFDGRKVASYTPINSILYNNPMFSGATNNSDVIVSETGF